MIGGSKYISLSNWGIANIDPLVFLIMLAGAIILWIVWWKGFK